MQCTHYKLKKGQVRHCQPPTHPRPVIFAIAHPICLSSRANKVPMMSVSKRANSPYPFPSLEYGGDAGVGLELLEGLERVEVGVGVVQADHEAYSDEVVVGKVVQEGAAVVAGGLGMEGSFKVGNQSVGNYASKYFIRTSLGTCCCSCRFIPLQLRREGRGEEEKKSTSLEVGQ